MDALSGRIGDDDRRDLSGTGQSDSMLRWLRQKPLHVPAPPSDFETSMTDVHQLSNESPYGGSRLYDDKKLIHYEGRMDSSSIPLGYTREHDHVLARQPNIHFTEIRSARRYFEEPAMNEPGATQMIPHPRKPSSSFPGPLDMRHDLFPTIYTNMYTGDLSPGPKIFEEDATPLDGKTSSKASDDSEHSQNSFIFDLDISFHNSDDETGSASEINSLLPMRSVLAIRLVCAYNPRQNNPGEDHESRNMDNSGLSSGSGTSSQPSEISGKRRRNGTRSSSGTDGPKSSRRRKPNSPTSEEKLLACPFCKHEPRKYRDCYRYIMRNISRLKQHLARYHQIPIHCPSCSVIFDGEYQRDEHIRARFCEVQPPRVWDGITERQKIQLRKRVSTNQTTEQNWYTIYDILFPGSPKPRSPYIDMPLSEELLGLREFAAEQGPSIISDSLEDVPEVLRPNEEEVRTFAVTMFQDAVGLLLQRFSESRSAIQGSAASRQDTPGLEENADECPPIDVPGDMVGNETNPEPDLVHPDPPHIPADSAILQTRHETGTNTMETQQLQDTASNTDQVPPWNPFGNPAPTIPDFEFIDPSYLHQLDEAATHWNPLFQHAFTSDSIA